MKIYIVGGSNRDALMGRPSQDTDYLIVGAKQADIEKLLADGYKQVGVDFPVFLHPKTGDEYALARIERKVGVGYTGFECETEGVTLEMDLARRDLTINAIAYDPQEGKYYDPYDGSSDIDRKIIRHVSDAFKEDPVRVLRVARFAARYSDFTVHESTLTLMRDMVSSGELDSLTKERVHAEVMKALSENKHFRFFDVLHQIGALKTLFGSALDWYQPGKMLFNINLHSADMRYAYYFHNATENELRKFSATSEQMHLIEKVQKIRAFVKNDMRTMKYVKSPGEILQFLSSVNAFRNWPDFHDAIYVACHVTGNIELNLLSTAHIDHYALCFMFVMDDCVKAVNSIDNHTLLKDVPTQKIKDIVHAEKIKMINRVLAEVYAGY